MFYLYDIATQLHIVIIETRIGTLNTGGGEPLQINCGPMRFHTDMDVSERDSTRLTNQEPKVVLMVISLRSCELRTAFLLQNVR